MNDADPSGHPSDVAFTPSVKAAQTRLGSRPLMARAERERPWRTVVTEDLAQFLEHVDSFFLATATADGQPYIQHRGGPAGFLKPLDEKTLGFADFGGNKQYVTVGNLAENDRAHIFLLHHATKQRVKLWGHARIVEGNEALRNLLAMPGYPGRIERAILFELTAWDANCQQHITARFSEEEIAPGINKLVARIKELEDEIARLGGGKPAD
jgi:predicted pyridoxine 5'-phosphate oxidase superfamily flavin-nucleotide-binding protein